MRTEAIDRIDGFPYRHSVRELMVKPVVSLPPDTLLASTIKVMAERAISSVVVVDGSGRAGGIVTERDILRCLASKGPAALETALGGAMSTPVIGVPEDALLYLAVGRMNRLNVRHLPVLDAQGRAVGMLTSRILLAVRSRQALALGDEIDLARDAAELKAAHSRLPALARALLAEEVPGTAIARVIAAATRDLTARAAELALADMEQRGAGPPPCRWCLLVLGSAGRGETLLAPDQDNALILDPPAGADMTSIDAWFASLAARINGLLDEAGVPLCKGGVMARELAYRRTVEGWRREIASWLASPEREAVLAAAIFFDMAPVAGDRSLGELLKQEAIATASTVRGFLRNLATGLDGAQGALGWFGRFRLDKGRVDLKLCGLMPVVAGARVLALRQGIAVTGTDERLAELARRGIINESDGDDIASARSLIVDAILRQQLADLANGQVPGSRVDPRRLGRPQRRRLRDAIARTALMEPMVESALSG